VSARADTIGYDVIVDTSSVDNDYGYIELQLNQGSNEPLLPMVTATITDFTGDFTLNSSDSNNDEINGSGSLPGTVTISDPASDYFEGLTFGNTLMFNVTLDGPGVSLEGDLNAGSGSIFSLTFYDADQTPIFATDTAALITVAYNGTVTAESDAGNVEVVPEPSTLWLSAGAGLLAFAFRRMRRHGALSWRFR
jgi:hypothetical protein